MSTFSDFKKDFYNRIGDGSMFDCGDINLLKVVLDGLRVKYAEKGNVHTPLFESLAAHKQFLFFRRLKMLVDGSSRAAKRVLNGIQKKQRGYVVIDHSGRVGYDENGKQHSLYFDRVTEALKENCFFVLEAPAKRDFSRDLDYALVSRWLQLQKLSGSDIQLRQSLQETLSRIEGAQVFSPSELQNIRAAFQLFFDYYRGWNEIMALLRPHTVVLGQHYHREGLLFALKRLGIASVELQHGLIAEEDVFYVFPFAVQSVIRRALFADFILVYGEFWKQRLLKGCEYPDERIGVAGYYHFETKGENRQLREMITQFKGEEKLLLVTTQTSLHSYFIEYLDWLAKDIFSKKMPWKIAVKPHPAEKKGIYDSLALNPNVRVVEGNLEHLFPLSDLHLSIYSTTLFDAIRFGVKSYALYVDEYGDYVNSMIAAGVAEKVDARTNFLEAINEQGKQLQPGYFYAGFNPQALSIARS